MASCWRVLVPLEIRGRFAHPFEQVIRIHPLDEQQVFCRPHAQRQHRMAVRDRLLVDDDRPPVDPPRHVVGLQQPLELIPGLCLALAAVLQGDLKTIKSGYGKNNVQIEYEGNGDFLEKNPLMSAYNNYGNYVEVRLAPGADAQQLLQMVAARSRVNKFELMEPSLEEIFINTVGKDNA